MMQMRARLLLRGTTILSVALVTLSVWCIVSLVREVDFALYLRLAYLLLALLLVSTVGLALTVLAGLRPWTLRAYYQLLWHGLLFVTLSALLVGRLVPSVRHGALSVLKTLFP